MGAQETAERNRVKRELRALEAKSTTAPDASGQVNDSAALNAQARMLRGQLGLKPTDPIPADE